MSSETFYDSFFDCSFDSNYSTEYNLCDNIWTANNPEAFPLTIDDVAYQYNSWYNKPNSDRTNKDVLRWMSKQAIDDNKQDKNYDDINLKNLINVTGDSLRNMTLEDFIHLTECSEDAELLYRSKEDLLKEQNQYGTTYDVTATQPTNETEELFQPYAEEKANRLTYSNSENYPSCTIQTPPKRRPGRPPKDIDKVRRKPEKKLGKLWEFLRNLLQDNNTCPSLIKWDDYNEGTFKFVESEKVAKLWGDRKQNTSMNYEKLSRAMRYYYKSKVLLPVQGKRLVYQFGPQASGWKTANPILDNN